MKTAAIAAPFGILARMRSPVNEVSVAPSPPGRKVIAPNNDGECINKTCGKNF